MKYLSLLLPMLLIFNIALLAQTNIDKIKAPSSPAASVIDIQPSTILSPKSYEALEASIFSNYFDGSGNAIIPNDLGVEFTPYWAKDRRLEINDYLFPSAIQSFVRNASISVASTQNYMINDTVNSNALGIGFRSTIHFPGKKIKDQVKKSKTDLIDVTKLKSHVNGYFAMFYATPPDPSDKDEIVEKLIVELRDQNDNIPFIDKTLLEKTLDDLSLMLLKELPTFTEVTIDDYLIITNEIIDKFCEIDTHLEKLEYYVNYKPGFKIDFAYALALNFPTNQFDYSLVPKQSFWITPSYSIKPKNAVINILGVFRYNWYDLDFYKKYFPEKTYFEYNLDFGLGLNVIYKKVSLNFEAVKRTGKSILEKSVDDSGVTTTKSKTDNDFQYVGNFSYQISDKMILSYSIGNKFAPIIESNGTLISSLSLNFGFGGPSTDQIYEK